MMNATCPECRRVFDSIREGKTRRAELFCSIRCADKAHPDMAASDDYEPIEYTLDDLEAEAEAGASRDCCEAPDLRDTSGTRDERGIVSICLNCGSFIFGGGS